MRAGSRRSLNEMEFPEVDLDELLHRVRRTVEASEIEEGTAYIHITRGVAPRAHAFPKPPVPPTELIVVRPYDDGPTALKREAGVSVVSRPDLRWKRCDVKSSNLLANVMALESATRAGAYEALLVRLRRFGHRGDPLLGPLGPRWPDRGDAERLDHLAGDDPVPDPEPRRRTRNPDGRGADQPGRLLRSRRGDPGRHDDRGPADRRGRRPTDRRRSARPRLRGSSRRPSNRRLKPGWPLGRPSHEGIPRARALRAGRRLDPPARPRRHGATRSPTATSWSSSWPGRTTPTPTRSARGCSTSSKDASARPRRSSSGPTARGWDKALEEGMAGGMQPIILVTSALQKWSVAHLDPLLKAIDHRDHVIGRRPAPSGRGLAALAGDISPGESSSPCRSSTSSHPAGCIAVRRSPGSSPNRRRGSSKSRSWPRRRS